MSYRDWVALEPQIRIKPAVCGWYKCRKKFQGTYVYYLARDNQRISYCCAAHRDLQLEQWAKRILARQEAQLPLFGKN